MAQLYWHAPLLWLVAGCASKADPPRDFEERLARGNTATFSLPLQCHDPASGQTFTEEQPASDPTAGPPLVD